MPDRLQALFFPVSFSVHPATILAPENLFFADVKAETGEEPIAGESR